MEMQNEKKKEHVYLKQNRTKSEMVYKKQKMCYRTSSCRL